MDVRRPTVTVLGFRYCSACGLRWSTPATGPCPLCAVKEERDHWRRSMRDLQTLVQECQVAIDRLRHDLYGKLKELEETIP